MTSGSRSPAAGRETGRRSVDVLYVSLGSTIGLRAADDQLIAALRATGLDVEVARVKVPRDVRTLMLTDLVQARAAARATREALGRVAPRRIIYSTTTAALLWPQPGAIRFDALAQHTRPGRHGLWQRRLELRRLREAPLLIPCDDTSLDGAPADVLDRPHVTVPIAISPAAATGQLRADAASDARAVNDQVDAVLGAAAAHGSGDQVVAITYAADAHKKGLDRVLSAWALARRPGEQLVVTGRASIPDGYGPLAGVHVAGRLDPAVFRALVRAVGVLVMAPRREDYGLVQLEALSEGARVATTAAPGPYAALALLRVLWPEQVVPEDADPPQLAAAMRHAIDARPDAEDLLRATAAVGPWRPDAVREQVERELTPALLAPRIT